MRQQNGVNCCFVFSSCVSEWLLFNAKLCIRQQSRVNCCFVFSSWVSEWLLFNAKLCTHHQSRVNCCFVFSSWVSEWLLFNVKLYIRQQSGVNCFFVFSSWVSEWVSECSLTPNEHSVGYIIAKTSYIFQWVDASAGGLFRVPQGIIHPLTLARFRNKPSSGTFIVKRWDCYTNNLNVPVSK